MIIEEDCEEADREEKSLSGRLLAPRATDEWLNEVPVGILKQAFTAVLQGSKYLCFSVYLSSQYSAHSIVFPCCCIDLFPLGGKAT